MPSDVIKEYIKSNPMANLNRKELLINKASKNNEYQNAGAIQDKVTKTFEVRYFKALGDIEFNTQLYRIIYDGNTYNITDYDDFKEEHITVKLLGVC